jgi:Tol biopolymer transport system component
MPARWPHTLLAKGLLSVSAACTILLAAMPVLPAQAGAAPFIKPGTLLFVTFSPENSAASAIQAVQPSRQRPSTILYLRRQIDSPHWSPHHRRIVFSMTSVNGRSSSLYLVGADGTGLVQLTRGRHFDDNPSWSPDGSRIAFASDRSGNWDIWIENLKTGALSRLTMSSATDWEPAWSPDGREIAFASNRAGNFDIWLEDLATGHLRRVTADPHADEYPSFAPDESRIAFASTRTGSWDIYTVSTKGSRLHRITWSTAVDLFPAWSPDGRQIAFESDRHGDFFNIYVRSVRGLSLRRITDSNTSGSDSIEPSWTR